MPGRRFLITAIMLLGAAIRLVHLAFIDLARPFYRGGLYAEFSQQIAANGYRLPREVPFYTDGGIPFAYPPLTFYVAAALLDFFHLPEYPLFNLLPALFSVLTLPSFYVLIRELRLDTRTELAALLVYATLPTAYSQHLGGAGLPEAFGSLALLWFALSLARAHNRRSLHSYAMAGLFWALCVVASPGTAYASVPTFGIFAIVQLARGEQRPRAHTLTLLAMCGVVAVAVSGPYWLTVMLNHGPGIFFETLAAQHAGRLADILSRVLSLRALQFSGTPAPFFWSVALFCGAVWSVLNRQWVLLAWFAVLYAIPREGYWMAAIPAAILAGIGCTQVLVPLLVNLVRSHPRLPERPAVAGALLLLLGISIVLTPFAQMARNVAAANREKLQPSRRALQAMDWVRTNTPADSKFIVLYDSYVKEWVPHIARRTVLNMAFGSEWEPEEAERIKGLGPLNDCRDFDCIQRHVERRMGYAEVYLYLERKRLSSMQVVPGGGRTPRASFELIWKNSEVGVGLLREQAGTSGLQTEAITSGRS